MNTPPPITGFPQLHRPPADSGLAEAIYTRAASQVIGQGDATPARFRQLVADCRAAAEVFHGEGKSDG